MSESESEEHFRSTPKWFFRNTIHGMRKNLPTPRKFSSYHRKSQKPVNPRYSANTVKKENFRSFKFNEDEPTEVPWKSAKNDTSLTKNHKLTKQYKGLKIKALTAVRNKMIFTINVNDGDIVRKALTDRGWVEKISPNISESKENNSIIIPDDELERQLLSKLLKVYPANFIWDSKGNTYRDYLEKVTNSYSKTNDIRNVLNRIQSGPIRNHLNVEALWTTNLGLCQCKKKNVTELNIPRTYMQLRGPEYNDFLRDYKTTACTSLLKWILSKTASKVSIFTDTGNISTNVIVFAINRCKEYLFMKENNDIHTELYSKTTAGQWNSFLSKYFILLSGKDVFHDENDDKLPVLMGYAKLLLKRIHENRPLLRSDGYHNVWVFKPNSGSTGKGVRMVSDFTAINHWLQTNRCANYVVQKYIEEPMLINKTKFVIKQYYLVTSTCPLVIWMYKDCYLKFSSQKYSLKAFHESINLNNYAVQKKCQDSSNQLGKIPKYYMWNLDTYKKYLQEIGQATVWDRVVYPSMKDTIIKIMLSSRDLSSCDRSVKCFGLYYCDFVLDKGYTPWLVVINSCSNPKPTTKLTAQFYPKIVQDVLRVVLDYAHIPKADTGKFECVYPRLTTPQQETKNLTSLQVPGNNNSWKLQSDTQPKTQPTSQPDVQLIAQMKPVFRKSKNALECRSTGTLVTEEQFYKNNVHLNDKMATYENKIESIYPITHSVSTYCENLCNDINSGQSASDDSKHSKNPNYIITTSSNLLKRVHVVGAQFARLLLLYFLLYLQSIIGIASLPQFVSESKRLRDSLSLRMSSPSRLFSNSVYDLSR